MSFIRNEKGSSLLMVIFVVAIVTILGLTLFTVNSSASKQFDRKEKQVQARHLAEMGVEHYKAEVTAVVDDFKDQPMERLTSLDSEGNEKYDHAKTVKNHITKLCDAIVDIKGNENLSSILEDANTIGAYEVQEDDDFSPCDEITSSTIQLVFDIVSTGNASGTSKVIEANVVVNTYVGEDSGGGLDPNPDEEGNKNPYPENPLWADVWNGHNLPSNPCISGTKSDKCSLQSAGLNGNMFMELDGLVYKNGPFEFQGHDTNKSTLIVNGSLFMSTSFKLGVDNGYTPSQVKVIVNGDLIVRGGTHILNNKYPVVVCGNFSYEPELDIKSGMLYVKGNVYERPNEGAKGQLIEGYKLILDQHKDYVSQACATSNIEQPNENPNFSVQPNVDPNYVN